MCAPLEKNFCAMPEPDPNIARRLMAFAFMAGLLSIAVGVIGLSGWVFHIAALTTLFPGMVAIAVNTTICLILVGFSLCAQVRAEPGQHPANALTRYVAKAAAVVPAVVGAISFGEALFGWDVGIDQRLLAETPAQAVGAIRPGLMSPITAIDMTLLGIALLCRDWKRWQRFWLPQLLCLVAGLAASFGILNYTLEPRVYHTFIAPQTAVTLFVFSFGVICSRTEYGLAALCCSPTLGGLLARRLLLPAILAPIFVGYIRWQIHSQWVGVTMTIVTMMILLAGLTISTAVVIDGIDQKRRTSEQELRLSRERLALALTAGRSGTFEWDIQNNLVVWSPEIEVLYGIPAGGFGGKYENWEALVEPDDLPAARVAIQESLSIGEFHGEWRIHRQNDGEVRVIDARAKILFDEAGEPDWMIGVNTDVTERKQAEEKIRGLNKELEERVQQRTAQLRHSEQSVRRKLESILSPEGDLGKLVLGYLLDLGAVQSLMDNFYALSGIPMFILDLNGTCLVSAGWQDICTKFHRVHPEACKNCEESDMLLTAGVAPGEFKLYKCKNNLWDVVTPITVGGQQVGNLFSGQFFFNDEPPDEPVFRAQAQRYGFDEKLYFAALKKVPRLSHESVNAGMAFLTRFAQILSQLSFSGIKLARSVTEVGRVNAELTASIKELEAFSYSVSHDLRAPLRHISAFSKMLLDEYRHGLPPEAQHYLERINQGTQRMGLLVDELLNLGRIGRQETRLQVT